MKAYTVSDNLRIILNELNMSQVDFAKNIGTTFAYINMILNRRRSSISRPLAQLIEERYGYSSSWILHGEGNKKVYPFKMHIRTNTRLKEALNRLSADEITMVFHYALALEELDGQNKEKRSLKKQKRV